MIGTIESRWGVCKYFLKDEYVGRSVRNYGEYNPDETEKVLELVSEREGLFVDIGANIGCIAMAVASAGRDVIAFEPQPEVYKLMAENVVSSGGEVVACNYALGSEEGVADMPKVAYSEKGNFGGLGIGTRSVLGYISVPVRTLDSLELPKVAMMKIDVEGFELEVLKGARETIMRDSPIMYIEDDRTDKSASLRKYIREDLGYWIEEHKPRLYRENNFLGLNKNIWAPYNFASHNIICRPC